MVTNLKERLRRLKPRNLKVYCVGAAKTGSTSLAAMFRPHYRAAHEPETSRTNQLVIDWLENSLSYEDVKQRLLERDRRLYLDVESAHPLGYVSSILAETFPRAKFIITIREPHAWLRSRLHFHYKFNPPAWEAYRNYFWWQRHQGYAPEEAILEQYGLCSLETYLQQYADHYERVLQLPKDRCLVIRTGDINDAPLLLAHFLKIRPDQLRMRHRNRHDDKIDPLREIDPEFVQEKVWHHCGRIIAQYFPETQALMGARSK